MRHTIEIVPYVLVYTAHHTQIFRPIKNVNIHTSILHTLHSYGAFFRAHKHKKPHGKRWHFTIPVLVSFGFMSALCRQPFERSSIPLAYALIHAAIPEKFSLRSNRVFALQNNIGFLLKWLELPVHWCPKNFKYWQKWLRGKYLNYWKLQNSLILVFQAICIRNGCLTSV